MTPDVIQRWRLLFVILEVYVGVFSLTFAFYGRGHRLEAMLGSNIVAAGLGIAWFISWLFLLVVSPFFLRSLRRVAIMGWLLAFGILVMGILTPKLWIRADYPAPFACQAVVLAPEWGRGREWKLAKPRTIPSKSNSPLQYAQGFQQTYGHKSQRWPCSAEES